VTGSASGATRPAPIVTDDSAAFWTAASDGRLVAQRCLGCGRVHHPPRPMCPHCHSVEHDLVDLAGTGTVYSYAVLHHPQHPAFAYPVVAALVDLAEGPRLVTNLVEIDPADVRIGMDVEVVFVPTVDDMAVPVFRPRGGDR
jgi:uncharacterized OB-fold protein